LSLDLPSIVIVGRPNVGKSTLFNRITKSRRAIVGNEPGITRDRLHLEVLWKQRRFLLTDTGGMTFGVAETFPELINEQVRIAVAEADHIIFVVDGRTELTSTDKELAAWLRKTEVPVTVAVNKCDVDNRDGLAGDFFELGFGDPEPISAEHDRNIEQLLGRVTEGIPTEKEVEDEADFEAGPEAQDEEQDEAEEPRLIRIAIIGRPNAGKSTLLNRLTGAEHAMVSPIAGTTRDAVDATVERDGVRFQIVDTAGIRRKGKTTEMAEKLSVMMAQRHLRMADVALMIVDAEEGVAALDANIAGYAHEAGKAVIVVINKWDLISHVQQSDFRTKARDALRFLDYAPIAFIAAKTGSKTDSLFPLIRKVFRESRKRITTGELNRFLDSVDFERATSPGFKRPKIYYVTQARVAPPTFVFFTNLTEKFHFSYERFLINQIRERFGFEGSPIRILNRTKKRKD
jgi:GTP-binding protein